MWSWFRKKKAVKVPVQELPKNRKYPLLLELTIDPKVDLTDLISSGWRHGSQSTLTTATMATIMHWLERDDGVFSYAAFPVIVGKVHIHLLALDLRTEEDTEWMKDQQRELVLHVDPKLFKGIELVSPVNNVPTNFLRQLINQICLLIRVRCRVVEVDQDGGGVSLLFDTHETSYDYDIIGIYAEHESIVSEMQL